MAASTPSATARVRRRGQVRAIVSVAILLSWIAGLSLLVRREFFVGSSQRLAEAALRVSPGAIFYVVEQGGRQVGFASTTIDTMPTSIDIVDYFVADLPAGASTRRASARSVVSLSRAFALRNFDVQTESPATPRRVGGRVEGDSAIVYAVTSTGTRPDSQRVGVPGPTLLPILVPLAVALGETPRVGRKYALPIFNPSTTEAGRTTFVIRAESLFSVVDSARLDSAKGVWVRAHIDTLRAWRVEPANGTAAGDFSGWVDAAGRVVERSLPGGLVVRRMAYEMAFENWRAARDLAPVVGAGNVSERTAISAAAVPGRIRLSSLTVVVGPSDLLHNDLSGGRQTRTGDTVRVRQEADSDLVPSWSLRQKWSPQFTAKFRSELRDERLLQVHDGRIVALALRIAGSERDPRVIAERITRWVHDSIAAQVTYGVPNALAIFRSRKGDCNEHAQLALGLMRSLGIPSHIAAGLLNVNGRFYYHMWLEVYLRDWVAVDPTFDQFPADAAHLRLMKGNMAREPELLREIGLLSIRVVEAR